MLFPTSSPASISTCRRLRLHFLVLFSLSASLVFYFYAGQHTDTQLERWWWETKPYLLCKSQSGNGNGKGREKHVTGPTDTETETEIRDVPQFVMEHIPVMYLHSAEKFFPGDISEHLRHTTPYLNYTPLTQTHSTPSTLSDLNTYGRDVYLTSDDNPANPPAWLCGESHRPNATTGYSTAPITIIWTQKPNNTIDAFFFYFYSFNQGNSVAGWRFGNHVGDWEHTAIRFVDGKPMQIFFSEHSMGAAYVWDAVEKYGDEKKRPVVYAAKGSHANYAAPGKHYYAIPFHLLSDSTDAGTMWDPALNNLVYRFTPAEGRGWGRGTLTPDHKRNPNAATAWLDYNGRWGDKFYPLSDRRQYRVAGQYHYVNGPTGPKFKNLARRVICQKRGAQNCEIKGVVGRVLGRMVEAEIRDEVEVVFDGVDDQVAGDADLKR